MRNCVLSVVSVAVGVCYAVATTAPPLPLDERVRRASHVFIGTADKMIMVDMTGKEVVPEPKILDRNQAIEMSVQVQEILRPDGWKTNMPVRVRFGGGFFSVKDIKERFGRRQFIFLVVNHDS